MKKYIYAISGAPDWAIAKRPMIEFEAPSLEKAWEHAEKHYGTGGELYQLAPRPTNSGPIEK